MDTSEIDTVKIEKTRAMMRYRRLRNIAKMFRAIEVLVALAVLSWSSTRLPASVAISGQYFLKLSVSLLNSTVVFLIGNAIVVGLYLLSRRNDADGGYRGTADLYDEYIQHSEARPRTTASASSGETPPPLKHSAPESEETISNHNQILPILNADLKIKCDAVEAAIKQATKEIKRFQRTQSEKLKRELRVKPRTALRRSASETYRTKIPSGNEQAMTLLETVEDLSNEEFRRTIDAFIEQQRVFSSLDTENV